MNKKTFFLLLTLIAAPFVVWGINVTVPQGQANKVLLGNANGTWSTVATSSLGITGGTGLATSTAIADTFVIYGTGVGTVGAESAFTYDDATDKLTVPYASTTAITVASNAYFPGSGVWNSSGVGIGTTTPATKLDIYAPVASGVGSALTLSGALGAVDAGHSIDFLHTKQYSYARIAGVTDSTGGGGVLSFYTSPDLGVTAATEKMRIDRFGNVGLGTTSPYAKLSVNGQAVAAYFTATSSTSTFAGVQTTQLAVTDTATSTFAGGIDVLRIRASALNCTGYGNSGKLTTDANGHLICAADNGGDGSGAAGTDGSIQFAVSGSLTADGNFIWDDANNTLLVTGTSSASVFVGTSTATSTFTGGIQAANLRATNINATGNLTTNTLTTTGLGTLASLSVGSLTGPLQAINGAVTASSSLSDSFIADTLTVTGGTLGSNSIASGATWTTLGTLTLGDGGDRIDINSNTWDVTNGVISGATYQGNVIAPAYGGTGVTGFGGTNTILYTSAANTFATSSTFVFSGGNLGIGTTTPATKLDIYAPVASGVGSALTLSGALGAVDAGHSIDFLHTKQYSYARIAGVTDSTGGGGVLSFYTSPDLGVTAATEKMRIDRFGNVGLGTTSPYAKLSVNGQAVAGWYTATTSTSTFAGLSISSNGLQVSNLNAANCDLKATTDGTFYCGTDATGSGSGVTASSTATYIVYKQGTTYYSYNASTTVTTSNADFDVLLQSLVDTLDGGRAGGIIHIKSGDYYANATTTIQGNDSGSYNNGGRVTIQGDGTDSTRIIMYGNADFLDFDDAAIFTVRDLSVYVSGSSNAFVSDSNDNDTRAAWLFEFDNIHVAATTTHTGYAFDLGNVFRGRFENIEMFETHNCMRFRAEGTFNPGDFVLSRAFCELDNTANGVSYEFTEDSTGFMNQVHFEMVEGIAQSTGSKFIKAEDLSFATFYNLNAEQYDYLVDQDEGSGVTYHFNYATLRDSTTGLTGCRFAVNASGNTCEFRIFNTTANTNVIDDANTWGDNPNTFIGYIGADAGTASASSSGETVYRDVKGYGTLDTNLAPGGLFGIFDIFGPLFAKAGATILSFLDIPSGTNPTVDAEGEMALDTTDNQLLVGDSGGTAFVAARKVQKIWSTTVASTSQAFIDGGLLPVPTEIDGYTMTAIRCKVDGGTSKVVAVEDASANSTEDVTCAATVTSDDGSITNATVTAAEEMYLDFGASVGSPNYVTISVFGVWTRE